MQQLEMPRHVQAKRAESSGFGFLPCGVCGVDSCGRELVVASSWAGASTVGFLDPA